jgi:hypothetical protein
MRIVLTLVRVVVVALPSLDNAVAFVHALIAAFDAQFEVALVDVGGGPTGCIS